EMKCEAHGTQQPRHINLIGEGVSTAQRSNSLVQSINQRFHNEPADSLYYSDTLSGIELKISIMLIS
ncbi:MAG: hypothetical protein LZF63_03405, partial [Nitrosomonas sp.]|nr:hypothetical protein [Nitrosomonas sp.]